jgi:hypothetical protein
MMPIRAQELGFARFDFICRLHLGGPMMYKDAPSKEDADHLINLGLVRRNDDWIMVTDKGVTLMQNGEV